MRLMLHAFRRGLLKSEHTFGITSVIRESIVLDTLGMEDNSDYMWRHMMAYNTVLAPHIDPKKIQNVFNEVKSDLDYIAAGYRFDKGNQVSPEQRLLKQSTSLVELFRRLQKSGIIDEFRKHADKIRQRIKERDGWNRPRNV